MVWCLASCMLLCVGLAILSLIAKPGRVWLPRLTFRRLIRGCLFTTFFSAAVIFALLSYLLLS